VPIPHTVALARSAVANAVKDGAPPDQIEFLRDDLCAAKEIARTDQAIADIIACAPTMTGEQAARVRQIFRYLPDADE
jgi:hypothetical protein